jgi:hypothetical protein
VQDAPVFLQARRVSRAHAQEAQLFEQFDQWRHDD